MTGKLSRALNGGDSASSPGLRQHMDLRMEPLGGSEQEVSDTMVVPDRVKEVGL